jgi:CO/xanthine dehydrogenase FAD-binding subunit
VGKKIDEAVVREASVLVAKAISPIDDLRSSAWYRARVAPTMVARAVLAAAERKRG